MLLKNSDRACVLCIRKCVLGYPNTCVQKSISKGMRYLNKCSLDCSDELYKAEVQGEAMQVLQPFFKTLHTLPGWHKEYDFFPRVAFQFRKTSTAHLFVLNFQTSSTETSFQLLLVIETGKTCLGVAASSTFQNCDRGGQCKVRLPLIKQPQLQKSQKTSFVTLTCKSVHVLTVSRKKKKHKLNTLMIFVLLCVYC